MHDPAVPALIRERAGPSRRELLRASAAASLAVVIGALPGAKTLIAKPRKRVRRKAHVAVIGAGAFGGWTTLHLLRRGARVTLVDAWGPGNSRSSSGGETRVIRAIYGGNRIYVHLVSRSFELWFENERRWDRKLYHRTGALWMFSVDDAYARDSVPLLQDVGMRVDELQIDDAKRRFPQIEFSGVRTAFYEREAGYLTARRACKVVLDGFVSEGGVYRQAKVQPSAIEGGELTGTSLSGDGSRLTADRYVFACGPWLGDVFPDLLGERIQSTRQEVFFFGTPASDARFSEGNLPVWVDFGEHIMYGIPGAGHRGFKVADDTLGAPFDPTSGERIPSAEGLANARSYLARRFPALADAPLLEARVCQYENSPDGHFIIDRHPEASNVWIVGGGSGHGFKLGPALGEYTAQLVLEDKEVNPFFALSRWD